jgi:hypothetical protein
MDGLLTIISRLFDPRGLLVTAALLSLCVSKNVGPSFLPLPILSDCVAENRQKNQHNPSFRPPPPAESDSFRVPMMAQMQKRADKEPQPLPLSVSLNAGYVLPDDARAASGFSYPITLFTSTSVSLPPGRAPPRLV